MKKLCAKCNKKPAVWFYMPSDWGCCDDCVNRGCTCQIVYTENEEPPYDKPKTWAWVETTPWAPEHKYEKGQVWWNIDGKGRPEPCCEFNYCEEGEEENA